MSFAQNRILYLNLANKAEHLLLSNNYDEAKTILLDLETKYKFLNGKDYFYLGITYYKSLDSLNGFEYLKKAALSYCFPSIHLKKYSKKYNFPISPKEYIILDSIEKLALNSRNQKVIDTLIYFINIDQQCRNNKVDVKCDASNQRNFLSYIVTNGIPNFNLYGDESSIIFLHIYDKKILKEYSKILFAEIKKGNMYPFYYAMMIDRFKYDTLRKSKYGTYGISKENFNLNKLIIKHRLQIGLSIYREGPSIMP